MNRQLIDEINFDQRGLIPAVVQNIEDNRVLMLAYMNRESLELTLKTGVTHFWSRSRKKLWQKGESSGNTQQVEEISLDCDGDTLLVRVKQRGVACHTGSYSCFFRFLQEAEENEKEASFKIIKKLHTLLKDRQKNPVEDSYTCQLLQEGRSKILKKVGEESIEVLLAAGEGSKEETIMELADLSYHLLVLLVQMGLEPEDIMQELKIRFGK